MIPEVAVDEKKATDRNIYVVEWVDRAKYVSGIARELCM